MDADKNFSHRSLLECIRELRTTAPDRARRILRKDGIRLFHAAVEANDLKAAHQLPDWGVLADCTAALIFHENSVDQKKLRFKLSANIQSFQHRNGE